MQQTIVLLLKGIRFIIKNCLKPIDWLISFLIFYSNGVCFSSYSNSGWPRVKIRKGGVCKIGTGFRSNNREFANPIGRFNKCSIIVSNKGKLLIGKNVGMSSTAIVCQKQIEIGDNVNIGGNVVIYDTDFHSLHPNDRIEREKDILGTKIKPVKIGDNVFIGAHSTILKGVTIGKNVVIGACSVITKDIPDDEIWAGNPAKCIRKVTFK